MIKIVEVKTKRQQKKFIEFPLKLYKKCPYFVPPLYSDELAMFKKNYHYYDQSEAICFNAYDENNKMVGRIQGIIQKASNEKWNQKRVRFTRFDSIDDQEVANALFNAVEQWGKSKQMEEIVGPLGFSDLEREGLLIEGFNEMSTFEEQYNYEYYAKLIENEGYEKEIDWVERQLKKPLEIDERYERISKLMMKKYKLHFGEVKNMNEFLDKYADGFFDILDETYDKIYGTVPFTESMKKNLIKSFKLIVSVDNVAVILDENEKIVAFALTFPSLSEALSRTKGKLTPITLIKLLKAIKKPKSIDLGLIGVLPEYEMRGISSAFIGTIMEWLSSGKYTHAETNLNLENNVHIQNQWKAFESRLHKRRRAYLKKIK